MEALLIVALLLTCGQSIEVLENADFEGAFGSSNWECSGCTAVTNTDTYYGQPITESFWKVNHSFTIHLNSKTSVC